MEIVKQLSGDVLEVRLTGRLDNHWSEPLDEALAEMIREGAHHLRLDLSGVNYLSSAGIGVLMNAYRDTIALHGSFRVTAASDRVRTVLELVALDSLLFGTATEETAAAPVADVVQRFETERASFECHPLGAANAECTLIGHPSATDASKLVTINRDVFALGVGALGDSYDECRGLFGEFVAAAGNAATMPTDGTSTPDYVTASGELVPELQALYAIRFRGSPAHFVRFEAAPGSSTTGAVPLSEVLAACAKVAGTNAFGIVMAAEVSGLVCAMLRQSPATNGGARLDFPAVREWLSFTPEREYARTSCIAAGVATASPSPAARPFLRPLSNELQGHVHAAVTAFRSLPQRKVELSDVLAQAFQPRSVFAVVHLLRDNRPIEGAGESEFQRGACWLFPLDAIEQEGAA